jgi:ribosomal-protein-alanine N-acetyltransferase
MINQPKELKTERLTLRPFVLSDAKDVQRLAGDRAVTDTTANIPHPYKDGLAESWIESHPKSLAEGKGVTFAVVLSETQELVGAINLQDIQPGHQAEIGYWFGKPYWGRGYGTEALAAILRYAFTELGLLRLHARCLSRNPASGRVMLKNGFQHEGTRRGHALKWGVLEDVEFYGILREDWVRLTIKTE